MTHVHVLHADSEYPCSNPATCPKGSPIFVACSSRGSRAAGVLVDTDLIRILRSHVCVGRLPSSLPPLLLPLLTLLDLFTHIAKGVWTTFEYDSIANTEYAVHRFVLKGGDDARHRLLDGGSFVLLKVSLAG
jgi:hypothetical protein